MTDFDTEDWFGLIIHECRKIRSKWLTIIQILTTGLRGKDPANVPALKEHETMIRKM